MPKLVSDAFKERHKYKPTIKNIRLWYWLKKNNISNDKLANFLEVQDIKIALYLRMEKTPSLREALLIYLLSEGEVSLMSYVNDLKVGQRTALFKLFKQVEQL